MRTNFYIDALWTSRSLSLTSCWDGTPIITLLSQQTRPVSHIRRGQWMDPVEWRDYAVQTAEPEMHPWPSITIRYEPQLTEDCYVVNPKPAEIAVVILSCSPWQTPMDTTNDKLGEPPVLVVKNHAHRISQFHVHHQFMYIMHKCMGPFSCFGTHRGFVTVDVEYCWGNHGVLLFWGTWKCLS